MRSVTLRRTVGQARVAVNRHRVIVLGLLGAAAVVAVIVALGPWPITHHQPRTSAAWVMKGKEVGRLNVDSGTIDLVRDLNTDVDSLVQDGPDAWAVTGPAGAARKVVHLTAADAQPADPIDIAAGEAVAVGGGQLARFSDGTLSVVALGGSAEARRHDLGFGNRTVVEVGRDGTAVAWDPERGRVALVAPGAESPKVDDAPTASGAAEVTLVGTKPAYLDRGSTKVLVPGRDGVDVPGGNLRLQLPGPGADAVVVASPSGLYAVSFDGALRKRAEAPASTGTIPRPTVDDRCAYALFPGSSADNAVAACDRGEVRTSVPTDAATTAFRSGPPVGVLNSAADGAGAAWFVDGSSWRKVAWPDKPKKPDQDKVRQFQPRSLEKNRAPVAVADTGEDVLGARPGRITVLPVLHNDYDPDRDPLTVVGVTPKDGPVKPTDDGSGVQVDLPADQTGTISFAYTISDGHDTATADATVRVRAPNENDAPRRISKEIPLAMGAAVGSPTRFDVVSQYWDPDGDPMYLAKAEIDPPRHRLEVDPVGFFTFTAADPTSVAVATTVADVPPAASAPQYAADQVQVDVTQGDAKKPILNSDVVTVAQGKTITFDPLANDIDPNGSGLELADVKAKEQAGPVSVSVANGRLTISAAAATEDAESTWVYTARSAGQEDFAFVHVRVVTDPGAPSLRDDVVVVQQDRTTRVDLLRNDTDPSDPSAVFAVTALTDPVNLSPGETPPAIALQPDMRTVAVDGGSAKPASYQYRYQAEVSSVGGRKNRLEANLIVVVEPGRSNRLPAPVVPAPRALVRAGSATSVALSQIIANPDDAPLVYELDNPSKGEAYLDGTSVRFRAPDDPGPVTVNVRALDALTRTPVTATVTFDVQPPGANSAPKPVGLEARVRSGQKVVVPVPLSGMDPDGDRVRLQSVASDEPPKRVLRAEVDVERQVIVVEARQLEADDVGGMETFSYVVEDGASSSAGRLRVFVLGRSPQARPPVAMPDRVVAPIGGTVVVDPLANDSDPDGQPLQLLPTVEPTGGCTAEAVRAGGSGGSPTTLTGIRIGSVKEGCSVGYRITAGASTPVAGEIRVIAVPGYQGKPPVLADDVAVRPKAGDEVAVDVLANDSDPDGDIAAAKIMKVTGGTVDDSSGGPKVRVTVGDEPKLAVYTVRDESGLEASAFVYVPGRSQNRPPVLTGEAPRIGSDRAPVTVDLARLVSDPDGDALEFGELRSPDFDLTGYEVGKTTFDLKLRQDSVAAGSYPLRIPVTDKRSEPVTLTVLVAVEAKANTPPTFLGAPACGDVEAGKGGQAVSLRSVVKDPDPGDLDRLEFQAELIGGGDQALTVKPTGTGLELTAAEQQAKDVPIRVQVRNVGASDWSDPRECKVKIKPTSLAPPSMQAVNEVLDEGQSKTVPVASKVANGGKVENIKVTGARVVSGGTVGAVSNTDQDVTFQASPRAAGNVAISVDFVDAFGRKGAGSIALRVRGRPDAPTAVVATAATSGGAVAVSWTPGSANNADITAFEVSGKSDKGGSAQRSCPGAAASCTLDKGAGIKNGEAWTFEVVAVNEVGASDKSKPSNAATPDVAPPKPDVASPKVGDQNLTASWTMPDFEGTPVDRYEWVATGPGTPISGIVESKGQTTGSVAIPLPGQNGKEFCITVRAHNAKGWGEASAAKSSCGSPFGDPILTLSPGTPTGPLQASFDMTADGNGRDITKVDTNAGTCSAQVDRTYTKVTVQCADAKADSVELTVRVENKEGRSASKTSTSDLTNAPFPQGDVLLAAAQDGVKVQDLPDTPGMNVVWSYLSSSGSWSTVGVGDTIRSPAFQRSAVKFRVCRDVRRPKDRDCNETVASNQVVPWGDPNVVDGDITYKDGVLTLTWRPSAWPTAPGGGYRTYELVADGSTVDVAIGPTSVGTASITIDQRGLNALAVRWVVRDKDDPTLSASGTKTQTTTTSSSSTTSSTTPQPPA